jgi:hypothetical protein
MPALGGKSMVAFAVGRTAVLTAVEFYHQSAFGTGEVSDVSSDRMLAAELGASHLAVAEMTPQLLLSVGLAVTEVTSESGRPPRGHGVTVLLTLTLSSWRRGIHPTHEEDAGHRVSLSPQPGLEAGTDGKTEG